MMVVRRMFIAAMSVAVLSGAARGADLDKAIKELVDAYAKLKSYRASVKSREHLLFENGNELDSTVTGQVEWMRKGDKLLYRADSESKSIQKVGVTETPMQARRTMVSDGEFFYTYIEVLDERQAAKQFPSPVLGANAERILEELKADYNLTLQKDQPWGGAPCYVFEATPKNEDASHLMAKAQYFFRKDTGTVVRTIGFDDKGNKTYSIDHFDVERDPKIEPDRFVFEVPDGVQITDMTNP